MATRLAGAVAYMCCARSGRAGCGPLPDRLARAAWRTEGPGRRRRAFAANVPRHPPIGGRLLLDFAAKTHRLRPASAPAGSDASSVANQMARVPMRPLRQGPRCPKRRVRVSSGANSRGRRRPEDIRRRGHPCPVPRETDERLPTLRSPGRRENRTMRDRFSRAADIGSGKAGAAAGEAEKKRPACAGLSGRWRSLRDSNPCFSLERATS